MKQEIKYVYAGKYPLSWAKKGSQEIGVYRSLKSL